MFCIDTIIQNLVAYWQSVNSNCSLCVKPFGRWTPNPSNSILNLTLLTEEVRTFLSLMCNWQNDGKMCGSDLLQIFFCFVLFCLTMYWKFVVFCKCALFWKVSSTILNDCLLIIIIIFIHTPLLSVIILYLGKLFHICTGFVYMHLQSYSQWLAVNRSR